MKIKQSYTSLCVAFLLFYPIWLPWQFTYITYILIDSYLTIYVIKRTLKSEWYSGVLVLCISMIIMDLYNLLCGTLDIGNCILGILFAIFIYDMERIIYIKSKRNCLDEFVHQVNVISIISNIVSSISVFLLIKNRTVDNFNYYLGDKFLCCYALILGIILFGADNKIPIKEKHRKKIIIILLGYSFIYEIIVNCMTATILTLIIGSCILIPFESIKKGLRNPLFAIISLFYVGSFPLWSSALLSNEKIQFLVTKVMHKNISLSGRMYIYSYISRFLKERQWYGYGYSNNIVEQTLGFGNIQNGLLDIALSYGVIVAIIFIFIVTIYWKMPNKSDNSSFIFWGVMFAMIIISSIEITFSTLIFYFSLFMCRYYSNTNNQSCSKKKVKYFWGTVRIN